jgi:hypothetical protein
VGSSFCQSFASSLFELEQSLEDNSGTHRANSCDSILATKIAMTTQKTSKWKLLRTSKWVILPLFFTIFLLARLIIPQPYRQLGAMLVSEFYYGSLETLKDKVEFGSSFVAAMDNMVEAEGGIMVPGLPKPDVSSSATLENALYRGEWANTPSQPTGASEIDTLRWHSYKTLSVLHGSLKQPALKERFTYSDPRILWLQNADVFLDTRNPITSSLDLPGAGAPIFTGLTYRPDVLPQTKLAAKGIAIEDFDGDGFFDCVIANSYGSPLVLRNNNGKGFIDVSTTSGLESATQAYSISTADVNNDGWIDLFFARPFHHYQLFINNKDGSFHDVTESAGLLKGPQFYGTWITSWGDVDRDGDLDVFLSQWGEEFLGTSGLLKKPALDSILFLNESTEQLVFFRDGTSESGLAPLVENQTFVASHFADINHDSFPELLLSRFNRDGLLLLRNNGGVFKRDTRLVSRKPGFTISVFDYNNDGSLDILQGGHGQAASAMRAALSNTPHEDSQSRLYLKNTHGEFAEASLTDQPIPFNSLGVSYGDINNDGCQDVSIGTGNPEPWYLTPNYLFVSTSKGDCGKPRKRFALPLPRSLQLMKMQGSVLFDADNDGDIDLLAACGGFWPGETCPVLYFENTSPKTNWIQLRLEGEQSNKFGVGARVRLESVDRLIVDQLVSSKSGFGSAPLLVSAQTSESIDEIYAKIDWPSGISTKHQLTMNRQYLLKESGELVSRSAP